MIPDWAWSTTIPFRPEQEQRRKLPLQLDSHADVGVPFGGIGAGTITRGLNGGFTRWTLKTGQVHYFEQPENGFALWHKGHGARALRPGPEEHPWHFDPSGWQAALFPKAWHSYQSGDLTLVIEQITPIAPGLTEDRDLPVGLFRAHLTNTGLEETEAAVMLSLTNLVGWFEGWNGVGAPGGIAGQHNRHFQSPEASGVTMARHLQADGTDAQGQITIALRSDAQINPSTLPSFDPRREAGPVWDHFAAHGDLNIQMQDWVTGGGFSEFPASHPVGAVAGRTSLAPGESRVLDFSIVWYVPQISFGLGRCHKRHYTVNWPESRFDSETLTGYALQQGERWSQAIDAFHAETRAALDLPDAAAALVMNEAYFLTAGLTAYTAPQGEKPAHFGLIECPDYPLYNTLDLWVYAAACVSRIAPDLAASVTRDYAAEVSKDDDEARLHLRSSQRFARQRAGMLPHDLGAPNADPFLHANDYTYQDSTQWKDLNAMFALCAWRDLRAGHGDAQALAPPVEEAMQALLRFDRDGDGLIENDGFPDQTFDNIPMQGVSAYCGGLWLAALRASAEICKAAGRDASQWQALSAKAEPAFTRKLWTGRHFAFDTEGAFSNVLFSEQLYGPATARLLGLGDTVPAEKARQALRLIYVENFLKAGHGRGVVAVTSAEHSSSLYAPKGEEGLQWDEILIGFNYSFANALRAYGLKDEAAQVLTALAQELGPRRGLHFRTPAAIVPGKPLWRAQMNMRPLAIWDQLATVPAKP